MIAQVGGPDAIEVVLLADIGEIARGRDHVAERAAGSLERLLEVLHGERGLLAHAGWQVELLVAMRMAVIDGRRRDAGQEDEAAAAHEQRGRIGHHHVPPPVGVVDDDDFLGHGLSSEGRGSRPDWTIGETHGGCQ